MQSENEFSPKASSSGVLIHLWSGCHAQQQVDNTKPTWRDASRGLSHVALFEIILSDVVIVILLVQYSFCGLCVCVFTLFACFFK